MNEWMNEYLQCKNHKPLPILSFPGTQLIGKNVEELVRSGQLTKEEARVHPQKNLITKALGVEEGIEPDFFQLEMKAGDRILLCSDGLTNMVEDKNLEKILVSLSDSRKAAEKMIEQANEKGGLDNIAVIVAKKEEER